MKNYPSEKEARELICEIGHRMWSKQMVAANDGNITVRVGENTVLITPTGVSKGELTPDMLFKIDLDGNILESADGYSPTSETAMHLMVYKHNKDAMSTCHAHCMYLSTFACAGIELDMATAPEPTLITGKIPVAPYACPGTSDLAQSIVPFLNDHKVILLANHGPISWGTSPKDAWYCLESAEAFAKSSLILKYIIKDFRPLSNEQLDILEKAFHPISALNKVRTGRETVNLEKGKSLQDIEVDSVTLSDDCIEKLADMVVKRMTSIS